jgi:hypothetical protein
MGGDGNQAAALVGDRLSSLRLARKRHEGEVNVDRKKVKPNALDRKFGKVTAGSKQMSATHGSSLGFGV